MRIESDGHSRGNPRLYELIEHAPKTGKSPTVWAWPELIDYLKVAGQPVAGPWPPHQQPRPDPDPDDVRRQGRSECLEVAMLDDIADDHECLSTTRSVSASSSSRWSCPSRQARARCA